MGKEVGGEAQITHLDLFIIGEVKKGKVTGFHNWIRFYMQEKEGLVDYYSHIYDGPVSTDADLMGWESLLASRLPVLILHSEQAGLSLALTLLAAYPGL